MLYSASSTSIVSGPVNRVLSVTKELKYEFECKDAGFQHYVAFSAVVYFDSVWSVEVWLNAFSSIAEFGVRGTLFEG